MITIFFTIVFIAELIITGWLISIILKADRMVCEANEKVLNLQPAIKEQIQGFKIAVNTVLLGVDFFASFLEKKKEECLNICSKNLITTILFFVLNNAGRKVLGFIDLFLALRKFLKSHK